jgi:hypothetical protein
MALGLLMCGRNTLPFNKVMIDLAVEGAWGNWAYRDRFSQVSTDIRNGSDGVLVMTRAGESKHVWHLYWDRSGREIAINARDRWADEDIDPEVVADSLDGDVPPDGWQALANDFLNRFDR